MILSCEDNSLFKDLELKLHEDEISDEPMDLDDEDLAMQNPKTFNSISHDNDILQMA